MKWSHIKKIKTAIGVETLNLAVLIDKINGRFLFCFVVDYEYREYAQYNGNTI